MRYNQRSEWMFRQAAIAPVYILVPILLGIFTPDHDSIIQHMSEMKLASPFLNSLDKGSTIAVGISVCLFGIACLWRTGTWRWSFTALVAVMGGVGMASNGVFAAGSPLHGLYGLPIFLVFVPAFYVAEFHHPTGKDLFRSISLLISLISLVYIWALLVGLDPVEYRGLTQRFCSLVTFLWYSLCVYNDKF